MVPERWRRAISSPWARRGAVGFLLGLTLASCDDYGPDQFNIDAASLICEVERVCGEDLLDPIELGFGTIDETSCFSDKQEIFETCQGECDFHENRAKRCIERLESMADDCDVLSLGPCRRVYDACEGSESCNPWNCAVGRDGGEGGVWALGLLLLGAAGRRRGGARGRGRR